MNAFKQRGYLNWQEASTLPGVPGQARQKAGPVACIECAECIPCNPCEAACPHGAIRVGHPITNLPSLDANACVGCGLCIPCCSGQAIFVVDRSGSEALVSMPYEFLPLPEPGDVMDGLDRAGRAVVKARVVRAVKPRSFDRTAVVTVAIPHEYANEVRAIGRVRP